MNHSADHAHGQPLFLGGREGGGLPISVCVLINIQETHLSFLLEDIHHTKREEGKNVSNREDRR